jgi:hypothetical protein
MQATVAICTHNGARRIAQVLESLAAQNLPAGDWETLVIDNASTDDTSVVAANSLARLQPDNGRVVCEATPGLTFARRRAANEARGDIICFLDDDNIPAPDFVASAVGAFARRRRAFAIGGKVNAVWEQEPSPLALAVQHFALAICDRGDNAFCYERNWGPVGAGLCIRTEVLRTIYSEHGGTTVLGRTGGRLTSGDDLLIGILAWKLGGECWYEPSLSIKHILPARRMEKSYLLKLYEGIGRGQAAVRRLYDWKARNRALVALIGVKDLGRWLRGRISGPSIALSSSPVGLAADLHELNQRLVWGRAMQALTGGRLK